MNLLAEEWLKKAEGDFRAAVVLSRTSGGQMYDAVCFHCQQSTEKYLKSYLVHEDVYFTRTHDLIELLTLALSKAPDLEFIREELIFLNRFSVSVRYPGDFATTEEVRRALNAMKNARKVIKSKTIPSKKKGKKKEKGR